MKRYSKTVNSAEASMKKVIKAARINAAADMGTTFYKTNVEQILDVLKDNDANVWLIAAFQNEGLNALDLEHHLFGSYEDGENLYICVTDGHEINVNDEEVDPELAMENYSVEQLSAYIKDATPEVILERITEFEIKPPYFDGWAAELLEDGHTFVELMEAAEEFID